MRRLSFAGYPVALALILLAAAIPRLWLLGRDDLWLDEIFSAWLVRQSPAQIWHFLKLENHPPLYYLLLWIWVQLVGNGSIAVRLLSILFGLLTVVVIARTARRTFSPPAGLFAGALAAFSAPLVLYAREARMYSLLAFFSALALDQALVFLQTRFRRSALGCAAALSLALLTHYYDLLVWLAVGIGVLLTLAADGDKPALRRWLTANLLPAAALLLWLPVLQIQWSNNHGTHWLLTQPMPGSAEILTFVAWSFGGASEADKIFSPFSSLALGAGALAAVVGAVTLLRFRRAERPTGKASTPTADALDALFLLTLTALLPVLIAFTVSQWKMIWQWKYLLGTIPALILLVSGLISLGAGRRGTVGAVAIFVGAALLAQAAIASWDATQRPHWNQNWRGAADFLRQKMTPSDIALVTQPDTLPPMWVCLTYFGASDNQLRGISQDPARATAPILQALSPAQRLFLVERGGDNPNIEALLRQHHWGKIAVRRFDGITITVFGPPRNETAAGASLTRGAKETKQ